MATTNGFPKKDLEQLGQKVRHLRQDSQGEAPRSRTRRRLQQEAAALAHEFESLVERWVQDEEQAAAWWRFLRDGAPPPDGPVFEQGPLFKGHTETNSEIEIRPASDGAYDILVDGKVTYHEKVPWHLEPDMRQPTQVGPYSCTEHYEAPEEAIAALRQYVWDPQSPPPWLHGRELYEDGLITRELELTPRGKRCVGKTGDGERVAGVAATHLVVTANGARARIFLLERPTGPQPGLASLVEAGHATDPEQRARDSEILSDARPGLRKESGPADPRAGHTSDRAEHQRRVANPRQGVSDRREHNRTLSKKRFAELAVEEAMRVWADKQPAELLLVASPEMLGLLRQAMAPHTKGQPRFEVSELARDLTWMEPAAIHDALADAELLPQRGRLPPVPPVGAQGLNAEQWRSI